MTVTVVEPAPFTLSSMAAQIRDYKDLRATIGFGGAMHPRAKISTAAIAAIHEFGTADQRIPERSFMRSALRLHSRELAEAQVQGLGRVIAGDMDAVESFVLVAQLTGRFVLERLDSASSWAVPLKQSTVDAKGFSTVLFETGWLREHLEWEVRRNGRFVRRGKVS